MWTAFPSSDYYGNSVTMGLSPVRQSRALLTLYVLARFRWPVRSVMRLIAPVLPSEVRVPKLKMGS
jgi:hypothetical protein